VKFIWNNSYMNCGCRWKGRMIVAVHYKLHIISLLTGRYELN